MVKFALTFDDSPPQDKEVVEFLNKNNIKATFFVSAKHFLQDWSREIYKEHEVGLHGFFHQDMKDLAQQTFPYHVFCPPPLAIDFDIQMSKYVVKGIYGYTPTSIAFPMDKGLDDPYLVKYVETQYKLFVRPLKGPFKVYHSADWDEAGFQKFQQEVIALHQKYELVTYSELRNETLS